MSGRWRLIGVALLLVCLAGWLAACGGGEAAEDERQVYAREVTAISTRTGDRLGELSNRSDYRSAETAARSTREYAAAVSDAAAALRRIEPPAAVAGQHAGLVRLYADTARSLEALAARFADADDAVALAALAQALSTQIQQYASQEQQLRTEIERQLASSSPRTSSSVSAANSMT